MLISKYLKVDREVGITRGKSKEEYALDCETMEWDEVSKGKNLFFYFYF